MQNWYHFLIAKCRFWAETNKAAVHSSMHKQVIRIISYLQHPCCLPACFEASKIVAVEKNGALEKLRLPVLVLTMHTHHHA